MAEIPSSPAAPVFTLVQAAQRLGTEAKPLANVARQHGFFTASGRDLFFTEAHLKALKALLKEKERAEKAAAARRKPKATFGIHESAELRKQRRRTKKRQVGKDAEA
ncbi:hypothetical protein [Labrys monachus]|uniref:Uncharacterized protein n=1 Tax=Labrys monachus TaxID=217067 RepID=A0ABU0FPL7_9HYPH|nr:hypothetical protein [Labrys monachus]MDQ0395985.1 hypothetical protein [Labrys monachus]